MHNENEIGHASKVDELDGVVSSVHEVADVHRLIRCNLILRKINWLGRVGKKVLTKGGGERNMRTSCSLLRVSLFTNAQRIPPSGHVLVCALGVSRRWLVSSPSAGG